MFKIREATSQDMPRVLELINALAIFEREPNEVQITAADLINDGFGEIPKFKCFVAYSKEVIVGMALVYTRYSTWKGKVLHLEDLIVDEVHRGEGVGSKLLDAVVDYGHQLGVKRISWEVLDWNEPAITFYKKKGAKVLRDWNVVQLDAAGIENYLKQSK